MTKEQEEAIEYFENKIKDVKPEYIETYVDGKLIRSETISLKMRFDKEDADKMQTVLSMLKEKDKEIEKKDKQIELMTEFLAGKDLGHYKRQDGGEILGRYRLYDKNEWKQYFKNKLNSSEQN